MTEFVSVASTELHELGRLSPNACGHVRAIKGGKFVTRRLAMLGIRPGVALKLVHGPGLHGVVVMAGGARIALGHGVIEHVLVEMDAKADQAGETRS